MIEVEIKFILNNEDTKHLIGDADFLRERVFTDIYYDTDGFSLTSRDRWLRSREGRFELKCPVYQKAERLADQYEELGDEQKIREVLNLSAKGSLTDDLARNGYRPFCSCKTTRSKYKKGLFVIDLDIVDFQDFTYNIAEIELMVNEKAEIEGAIHDILSFAGKRKLIIAPVRGKVVEYLKRKRPDHYHVLVLAGVIEDF